MQTVCENCSPMERKESDLTLVYMYMISGFHYINMNRMIESYIILYQHAPILCWWV